MGKSAIGVIRVSGPAALAVVAPVLKCSAPLEDFPSHTLRRVTVVVPATGERVDQALCVVMRAPRSATGEDVVELSCHGSPALRRMVTRWLIAGGARLAEPGEFTRRAFLNGLADEVGHRAASLGDEGGIVASLRQMEVLDALARALASAEAALAEAPLEAALVDLRDALASASDILGIEVGDAVRDRIFSTFCLGK